MPRKKLTPKQAKALLIADGMDFQQDFHVLGSSAVQALADVAKLTGYRKSKNAPGSTARMFYQYLSRVEPVMQVPGQLSPAERRAYQARAKKTQHATMKKSGAQLDHEIAHALAKQSPSARRFSVELIHNGSDWAVVNATAKDIATDDGFAMTHADAVKLAKTSAKRDKCRWFDMSMS